MAVKVLVSESFQPEKNFTLLVMLGMVMVVEGRVSPFVTERLNRLNIFSLVVLYVTLVLELVF